MENWITSWMRSGRCHEDNHLASGAKPSCLLHLIGLTERKREREREKERKRSRQKGCNLLDSSRISKKLSPFSSWADPLVNGFVQLPSRTNTFICKYLSSLDKFIFRNDIPPGTLSIPIQSGPFDCLHDNVVHHRRIHRAVSLMMNRKHLHYHRFHEPNYGSILILPL